MYTNRDKNNGINIYQKGDLTNYIALW